MHSDSVEQLLQACREQLGVGQGYEEAERLITYAAAHPDQAPTMRRLGQSAHAAGNPALAAILFRAALAGITPNRASSHRLETTCADRGTGNGSVDIFDSSAIEYVEQQSLEIERGRSLFDFAEGRVRRPARQASEPVAPTGTPQRTATEDDLLSSDSDDDQSPHQTTIFEALIEGTDLVAADEFEEQDEFDDVEVPSTWDSRPGRQPLSQSIPELNWDTLGSATYDYDEAPTRDELIDIDVEGKLPRHQRAFQEAMQFGLEYGWDETGVRLLAEIFETYFWSSTKRSLRTALDSGCTPEELELAHESRLLWQRSPHFGLNLAGYEHQFLSWPLAIEVVRAFHCLPDLSEIEAFLDSAYDDWRSMSHLQHAYAAFRDYVKARLSSSFNAALCSPAVEFESSIPIGQYESESAVDSGRNTPALVTLHDYGLIPMPEVDPTISRVGIVEWHEDVKSWVERP